MPTNQFKPDNPGCDCGCDCLDCDDLFNLNWLAGICLSYPGISGLSGAEDAANQAWIDGLNSVFGNIAVSWNNFTFTPSFTVGATYEVNVCQVDDYTDYTVYSRASGALGPFTWSTHVSRTTLTFGAWWNVLAPCRPSWFWLITTLYQYNPSGPFFGAFENNLINSVSSTNTWPRDIAWFGPSSLYRYPRSPVTNPWTAVTDTAADCVNPATDATLNTALKTRYGPSTQEWSNGINTTPIVVAPLVTSGVLNLSNSAGTPLPLPTCI